MLAEITKTALDRAWNELERLSAEIGPRVAGTANERTAAEMLTSAFAERGLDVIQRSFRWVSWEPIGQPHVEITLGDGSQRQLRTAPMAYTDSTPTGGVTGQLTPAGICEFVPGLLAWPRYAVEQGGVPLAFIAVVPTDKLGHFLAPNANCHSSRL